MKITIDTKEDSHEEIKRVIRLLQHMVGEGSAIYTNAPEKQPNIFEDTQGTQAPTQDLFSMFGDANPGTAKQEAAPEVKKEQKVRIIPY